MTSHMCCCCCFSLLFFFCFFRRSFVPSHLATCHMLL
jgi:hypothetical protein